MPDAEQNTCVGRTAACYCPMYQGMKGLISIKAKSATHLETMGDEECPVNKTIKTYMYADAMSSTWLCSANRLATLGA